MIIRPELLTHPNIPKPLHGTNPRSILGQEWWDKTRKQTYARNDYHCMACGIHKSQDKFHNWLEAHESYSIDYESGRVVLNEIVALCHSCHNFIHSGRLQAMVASGETSEEKAIYILKRGFAILKANNLEPFWGTAYAFSEMAGRDDLIERIEALKKKQDVVIQQDWSKWHLEIDGVKHYGKFKSQIDWQIQYGR